MTITDAQAVGYGILVMYAEDMYTPGLLKPVVDPHIAAAGWTVVGFLTAQDAVFPSKSDPDQSLRIDPMSRVFFGFVAKNTANPALFVVAIRGTDGIVEWVIDAEFHLIPHPRHANVCVEQGFWNVYQTMSLADPTTGLTTHQNAAEGIASLIGTGTVIVAGHSLGSALGTYLADDLAERVGASVSACLFASPRTGDPAWAALFDAAVAGGYRLFNYILDIVTHVPSLGYATLSKATVLQPASAQAGICVDILCNHHVLCYCAMLDYADTAAETPLNSAQGVYGETCILGQANTVPDLAKALAAVINEFGVGDERSLAMLKALHTVSHLGPGPAVAATAAARQPPTAPFLPSTPR
jgi:triacylglycerol lipase